MKVTCTLPNASHEINGIKFAPLPDGTGVVATNVSPDAAAMFDGIPGYEIGADDEVAAPPAGRKAPTRAQYMQSVESAAAAIIEGVAGATSGAACAKMMVEDGFVADEAELAADIDKRASELKEAAEAAAKVAQDAADKAKKDAVDKAAAGTAGATGQGTTIIGGPAPTGAPGPAAAPTGAPEGEQKPKPATDSTKGVQF